jgi:hypothetical protein
MASIIKIKRSAVTGQAPTTSQLQAGELAINTTDGVMYSANSTAVFEVGANLSSLSINSISFPTTDGNNGQAIITDGNGNLTFGNVATQSSNVVLTANATINSRANAEQPKPVLLRQCRGNRTSTFDAKRTRIYWKVGPKKVKVLYR